MESLRPRRARESVARRRRLLRRMAMMRKLALRRSSKGKRTRVTMVLDD
jgi:hypothetical protein